MRIQLHQIDAIANHAIDEIENGIGRIIPDYEFTPEQAESLNDILVKFMERNLKDV